MKAQLNLWNIHYWLLQNGISHLYTFEDELEPFIGIRFYTPEANAEQYALLFDEPNSHQYASVLTFQNSRIYFQKHNSTQAMNILNQIFAEYQQLIHKLHNMNLDRAPISELLQTISDFLNCPIMILKNTRIIACTPDQDNLIQQVTNTLFNENLKNTFELWLNSPEANSFTYPKIVHLNNMSPILLERFEFQQSYIWIIGIDVAHQMPYGNINLFETALQAIYNNLIQTGSGFLEYTIYETETCFLSFANQILPAKSSSQHTLNKLHWKKDDVYTVYRIELFNYSDSLLLNQILFHLNKAFPKTYSIISGHGIYFFCNKTLFGRLITVEDFEKILPLCYVYIGQSNIQNDFFTLPILIQQSLEAVNYGRTRDHHFLFAQEIFKEMLYNKLNDDRMLQSLIHPSVQELMRLDYSDSCKGYFLKTLKCYLICGANISLTAKKLNIHRNTLINRLDKIQQITHLDLADSNTLESLLQSILLCPSNASL